MANRESAEMVSNLMEMAQKSWQQWLEFGQQWSRSGQNVENLDQAWQENLNAMENLVQDALKVQAEWIRLCRHAGMGGEQAPRPLSDMNETSCNLMENWLEARTALWERWFEQARRLDLNRPDLPLQSDDAQEEFFDVWRNMVDTMMKSQKALMHQVEELAEEQGVTPPPPPAAAEKAPRKTARQAPKAGTGRKPGGDDGDKGGSGQGGAGTGGQTASGGASEAKGAGRAARSASGRRSSGSSTQKPTSH